MAAGAEGGGGALDAAHAQSMDRMYRYQRHIYDATRKYYLFGRDRLIRELDAPPGSRVLEAACGTGRNLRRIADLYPGATLYGFDISAEMLTSARSKFQDGKGTRPVFRVADATSFAATDFGVEGFDRIVLSYAVSMIPDWAGAIERAVETLAPGGSLHIVDFGQQEGLPAAFRAVLVGWLAKFHVTPRPTLRAVLDRQAARRGARVDFQTVGRGYAWHAVLSLPPAP